MPTLSKKQKTSSSERTFKIDLPLELKPFFSKKSIHYTMTRTGELILGHKKQTTELIIVNYDIQKFRDNHKKIKTQI